MWWNILDFELGKDFSFFFFTSPVAQMVKRLPAMQETRVRSLGWEDPQRRKWQPTPVRLPGKSHGQRSLVSYSPWGCKELNTTEQLLFLSFKDFFRKMPPLKSIKDKIDKLDFIKIKSSAIWKTLFGNERTSWLGENICKSYIQYKTSINNV